MKLEVKVNYRGPRLKQLGRLLRGRGSSPEFRKAFEQIQAIYRAFLIQRYRRFSAKQGNWKHLAQSTIDRKGHDTILVDTTLMFKEFRPVIVRTEGVLHPKNRIGLVIEYGTDAVYPTGQKVAYIMAIHDQGGGRLPRRKLIVGMDEETARLAAHIVDRQMEAFLKKRGEL